MKTAQAPELIALYLENEAAIERYLLYHRTRHNRPRCLVCGSLVMYLKANDRHILCEVHTKTYEPKPLKRGAGAASTPAIHLKSIRESRGMTATDLSRASGVQAPTIRHAEKGASDGTSDGMQRKTLRKIAAALGVSEGEITG